MGYIALPPGIARNAQLINQLIYPSGDSALREFSYHEMLVYCVFIIHLLSIDLFIYVFIYWSLIFSFIH